jgi:hypothetical protein
MSEIDMMEKEREKELGLKRSFKSLPLRRARSGAVEPKGSFPPLRMKGLNKSGTVSKISGKRKG